MHNDRIVRVPNCSVVRLVLGFGVHKVLIEPKSRLGRDGRVLDDIFLSNCYGKYPKDGSFFHAILPQSQTILYHKSSLPSDKSEKQNF